MTISQRVRGSEDNYLTRYQNMKSKKYHHIRMVSDTQDRVYTERQFQYHKLAKSPLEKVTVTVSVQELEKMRHNARLNYSGIDNETIVREFITRKLNERRKV
jgi:hypothetical protein